jgi:hypothetical protein
MTLLNSSNLKNTSYIPEEKLNVPKYFGTGVILSPIISYIAWIVGALLGWMIGTPIYWCNNDSDWNELSLEYFLPKIKS